MNRHHQKSFPGESEEYRAARDALLDSEIELRAQLERVAEQRRRLPPGGLVRQDYEFEEATPGLETGRRVRLSELFAPGRDSLIVYNFMFGPDWQQPCPMCTSMIDAYDGNAAYLRERANLVVVARAPAARLRDWAEQRGWTRLRLLSSAGNSFNRDYHAEYPSSYGDQHPAQHVFRRAVDGIRHFWSAELLYCELDGQPRHVDLTWPLWNLLDLTPEGRGSDWYPRYQR